MPMINYVRNMVEICKQKNKLNKGGKRKIIVYLIKKYQLIK